MNTNYKHIEFIAKSGGWETIGWQTNNKTPRSNPKIDEKIINSVSYGVGCMKTNLVGVAAQAGTLDKFPKEMITTEALTTPNDTGETPMHFICSKANHQLQFLPEGLINNKTLLINNKDLTTPFHYLSFHGNLLDIDKALLSSKNLELTNKSGLSPLDFSMFAINGEFSALPYPPTDIGERFKKIKLQIKTILSLISDQFLKKQIELPKDSKFYKEKLKVLNVELAKRSLKKRSEENSKYLEI